MLDKKSKNKTTYDVMIIGAGPAGATAARELVKDGYRVLIVEKEKLPRYKICSGLITDRAQDLLQEHFGTPPDDVFSNPRYLSGARLCLKGNSLIDVPLEKPRVYNVWRSSFDHWLIQLSGADVLDEHKLTGFKQTGDTVQAIICKSGSTPFQIQASYLIGADGGNSLVRRLLDTDFERKITWATFMQVYCRASINLDHKYYYMFFDPSLKSFYTWLNFKDDYLVYGVGALRGERITPYFNDSTEYLKKHFGLKLDKIERKAGCLGTDMAISNNFFLGSGRVLLAGEAAGFMNIFGEGISSAFATGNLAAKSIHQAHTSGREALTIYSEFAGIEEKLTTTSWEIAHKILGRDFLNRTNEEHRNNQPEANSMRNLKHG